jgi:hypothetical protein
VVPSQADFVLSLAGWTLSTAKAPEAPGPILDGRLSMVASKGPTEDEQDFENRKAIVTVIAETVRAAAR